VINIFYLGLTLVITAAKGILDTINDRIADNANLKETELLLGYTPGIIRKPIIVNMETTPHLFVCGLSGNGKSCMVEFAIKGRKVVLINAFKKDFKGIKARRINSNEKILEYLTELIKDIYYHAEPLYLVFDELLVLCIDNKITKAIMDILAIGRHYNIYVIGISQIGTKEVVKFKELFNTRVCFRQVEESSYRSVLGYSPEIRELSKRQFLFYSETTGNGYTYDVGLSR
jgi:DNA segregation ATPase FtsK/SpoIIIE-like protein